MKKCPYCYKSLKSWKSVIGHTSSCSNRTGEYFIDNYHGPIHYSFFNNSIEFIREKYPCLKSISDIRKNFAKRNIIISCKKLTYTDEELLNSIRLFVEKYERVPQIRDFEKSSFPNRETIKDRFGSWNKAIELAGFTANYNNGLGTRIFGLDGILYRSSYEAKFANKHLYGKENYIYELKYPNHNKFYDFYLPDKDIYIEIDGGLRPEVTQEKIEINKQLNRNLIVVKAKYINSFKLIG